MPTSLLIGHSLGGAAVLRAAHKMKAIKAEATIGASFDPAHVIHHFADALPEITSKGVAEVSLGGRPFSTGKQFVEDIGQGALTPAIGKLKVALLILHAPRDAVVSIDNASQIFLAAKHPKSFVILDDAGHLISRPQDTEYASEIVSAWAPKYLEMTLPAAPKGPPEGVVRSAEADPKGFLQDISAGPSHHMLADEPTPFGDTDCGPSPYGFLAAGLAVCTSMTIRMYARRKG